MVSRFVRAFARREGALGACEKVIFFGIVKKANAVGAFVCACVKYSEKGRKLMAQDAGVSDAAAPTLG